MICGRGEKVTQGNGGKEEEGYRGNASAARVNGNAVRSGMNAGDAGGIFDRVAMTGTGVFRQRRHLIQFNLRRSGTQVVFRVTRVHPEVPLAQVSVGGKGKKEEVFG